MVIKTTHGEFYEFLNKITDHWVESKQRTNSTEVKTELDKWWRQYTGDCRFHVPEE